MTERGYSRHGYGGQSAGTGCICPEDFEHDGPCQNLLREKKAAKCAPCSSGWHLPYPCNEYQSKDFKTVNTQCQRCGWDSSEHPDVQERWREITVDLRTYRRTQPT